MLKLLKHEFRATGRIMVPAFGIVLLLSLMSKLSASAFLLPDCSGSGSSFFSLLGGLIIAAYFIAIIGLTITGYIYMIVRFWKNLMGDEGYLTLTLPVSVHQHIWAKLIPATVWMALAGLVIITSMLILVPRDFPLTYYLDTILGVFKDVIVRYDIPAAGIAAAIVGLSILGVIAGYLMCYACIALGHSFANNRLVWSIVIFIGVQFVGNLLGGLPIFDSVLDPISLSTELEAGGDALAVIWRAIGMGYATTLLRGALFYCVTAYCLKHRLNLD